MGGHSGFFKHHAELGGLSLRGGHERQGKMLGPANKGSQKGRDLFRATQRVRAEEVWEPGVAFQAWASSLAAPPLGSKGGPKTRVPSLSNSPLTCSEGWGELCVQWAWFGQIYV